MKKKMLYLKICAELVTISSTKYSDLKIVIKLIIKK